MKQTSPYNGFTLVELAIVLMIIGLLIGGVLRGQELMNNARVNSTIEQVKAYQAAFVSFTDAYNNYPGDMATATTKIPNCNAANNCLNGNGDSIIGAQNAGQDSMANEPWMASDPSVTSETMQFWKHLALAHLITGINPSASTWGWGSSQPVSKLGTGGFFVRYTNENFAGNILSGHLLLMRNDINGMSCPSPNGFCAAAPQRAVQVDRKMDDGLAMKGSVLAVSSQYQSGCGFVNTGINGPSGYDEKNPVPTCDMIFMIQ